MLLIDLGVPRNIEDQVRDIENAYLFSIEDMELVTQENLEERIEEAHKANDLIKNKVALVGSRLEFKKKKNNMYLDLQKLCSNLDENQINSILIADDPLKTMQQLLKHTDDQLQCLSNLNSHEILSMLKEINSAR